MSTTGCGTIRRAWCTTGLRTRVSRFRATHRSSWPSARAHAEATGTAPALVPTTATTDARAFVSNGIPAVCLGPLAESIHGIDERVHVPSIVTTAETLALLVRDWCGVVA